MLLVNSNIKIVHFFFENIELSTEIVTWNSLDSLFSLWTWISYAACWTIWSLRTCGTDWPYRSLSTLMPNRSTRSHCTS